LLLIWSRGWAWIHTQDQVIERVASLGSQLVQILENQNALGVRLEALELGRAGLTETVGQTFVRRSELEPQLRALKEAFDDQRMMTRQLLERYRSSDGRQ